MDHISWLSDVYGPRLTGGPGIRQAGDWTLKKFAEWGLANAHLETWPFGKGWSLVRFSAHLIEPQVQPLIGFPGSWTPGTNGAVIADVVRVQIDDRSGLREVPRQAERQDRPDAAGARRAHARRTVRPADDGQGLSKKREPIPTAGRAARGRGGRGAARRTRRGASASSRSSRSSTRPKGVVALFNRGSDSDTSAGGSELSWRAAAARRRHDLPDGRRLARRRRRHGAADGHARGRALQPAGPHPRQGRAGQGRAERPDEVLRRDDAATASTSSPRCPAPIRR